jgi:carbon monoxide dehydrogenase subunit G
MEITNEFSVSVPIDEAWAVLTDLERIAPCMPGATLESVEGEDYLGTVKIKVGPITSSYKGKVRFTEKDDAAHKAVLRAEGRDTKGQGNASADITASLTEQDGKTKCVVDMNLTISGRVAQFGRGVLADVSQKLVEQFVERLEQEVLGENSASDEAAPTSEATASNGSAPSTEHKATTSSGEGARASSTSSASSSKSDGSVDALALVAKPIAKRALPIFALLVVIGVILRRRKRKS